MLRVVALATLCCSPAIAQTPQVFVPQEIARYVAYIGVGGGSYTVNTQPGFVSDAEAAAIIQPLCSAKGQQAAASQTQRYRLVTDGKTGETLLSRRVRCQ